MRTEHLNKQEQEEIVEKLPSGVSNKLESINLSNRDDFGYFKENIKVEKRRYPNEMAVIAMKYEEWNCNGKNCTSLYKKNW